MYFPYLVFQISVHTKNNLYTRQNHLLIAIYICEPAERYNSFIGKQKLFLLKADPFLANWFSINIMKSIPIIVQHVRM